MGASLYIGIRRFLAVFICTVFSAVYVAAPALALTPAQQKVFQREINYLNTEVCGDVEASADSSTGTPANPGDPSATATNLDLREKIGQMMFVGATNNKQEVIDVVEKYKVGGVMLTNESTSLYSKAAIGDIKSASDNLLIASDEEGGKVQRLKGQTGAYPSAKALGAMTAAEVEKSAKEYGDKLVDLGITVNYAPVVDIDDGNNSVISGNNPAFSSGADEIAEKAGAFAKGMRAAKVTPVFKHFPGHGRASGDSHTIAVTTPHINSLKSKDLKPYEELLKNGISGVMVGHLIVPGLTNGKQATISKPAIDLLRAAPYSFTGVVFTDEIANMKAISDLYSPAEAVSLSIQAGVDMPLFNKSPKYGSLDEQVKITIDKVEADVNSGKIAKGDIDSSLTRINALKAGSPAKAPAAATNGACGCSVAASSLSGGTDAAKAFNYFIGAPANLSPIAASGIVGNLMRETGGDTENLNPLAHNPSPFDGIAQWDISRWAALNDYAAKKKQKNEQPNDPHSLDLQLEYIWHELNTNPGLGLAQLKAATSAADAATVVYDKYEGANHGLDLRISNAEKIYQKYGNGAPGSGSTPASSTGCADQATAEGSGDSAGNFIWPVPGDLFGCWDEQRPGHRHSGIDIGSGVGTATKASDGGTVEFVQKGSTGYGYVIVLKHSGDKWTLYGHMSVISVTQGKKVSQGDIIGKSGGKPGTAGAGSSQGPHVHFNIQKAGGPQGGSDNTLNPLNYLPVDGRNLGGCKATNV